MKTASEIRSRNLDTLSTAQDERIDFYRTLVDIFTEDWYSQKPCPITQKMSMSKFNKTFSISSKADSKTVIRMLEKEGFRISLKRKFFLRQVCIVAQNA